MDEKLTIGVFMLGCVIIVGVILGYNRIERLEDMIIKQQDTIELQQQAINMKNMETAMYKSMLGLK